MASSCCCPNYMNTGATWVVGSLPTPEGDVDQICSRFDWRDRLSWWRVRWGIGRMGMAIRPGLYALNTPTAESEVFVTANYKMSFDHLRHSLADRNAWVLVLDTQGINVWCAAGKGSFGTAELTTRIIDAGLARLVSHGRVILPQLGAVGVDARAVSAETGFRVLYGPVRAEDLPAFLDAGREATDTMRRVTFRTWERAVLVPIEIINAGKFLVPSMVGLFVLSGVSRAGISVELMQNRGPVSVMALAAAWLGGAVLGPILLPVLPPRMFSTKGAMAAGLALGAVHACGGFSGAGLWETIAFWLVMPAIASFIMMNFTGATPYTSPSGVRLEMKRSVPVQAICAGLGVVLWVYQRFAAG